MDLSTSSLGVPTVHADGTVGAIVPVVVSFDSDPTANGVAAPLGSLGLRTDDASVYVKIGLSPTDWDLLTNSVPPPPSATLTMTRTFLGDRSTPASLNASSEGTIDWFVPFDAPLNASKWTVGGSGISGSHEKLGGLGHLSIGAAYVANGVPYNVIVNVGTDFSRTTNVDDDNCAAALSGDHHYAAISTHVLNASGERGPGFRLVVPALSTPCVLRVYTDQFLCPVTCYATLVGSTAMPVSSVYTTDMNDSPSGPFPNQYGKNKWEIRYQSSQPAWLEVLVLMTGIFLPQPIHDPWVSFVAATIAPT
jgi:hypothetical protein